MRIRIRSRRKRRRGSAECGMRNAESRMPSPTEHLPTDQLPDGEAVRRLRLSVYFLLIALAVGNMTGRILAVNSVDFARLETYLKEQKRKQLKEREPNLTNE